LFTLQKGFFFSGTMTDVFFIATTQSQATSDVLVTLFDYDAVVALGPPQGGGALEPRGVRALYEGDAVAAVAFAAFGHEQNTDRTRQHVATMLDTEVCGEHERGSFPDLWSEGARRAPQVAFQAPTFRRFVSNELRERGVVDHLLHLLSRSAADAKTRAESHIDGRSSPSDAIRAAQWSILWEAQTVERVAHQIALVLLQILFGCQLAAVAPDGVGRFHLYPLVPALTRLDIDDEIVLPFRVSAESLFVWYEAVSDDSDSESSGEGSGDLAAAAAAAAAAATAAAATAAAAGPRTSALPQECPSRAAVNEAIHVQKNAGDHLRVRSSSPSHVYIECTQCKLGSTAPARAAMPGRS